VALNATCWRSQLAGNFMWLPVTIRSGEVYQTAAVRKERKMREEQQGHAGKIMALLWLRTS